MAQRNTLGRTAESGPGGRTRPSSELPEPDGAEQSSSTERGLIDNDAELESETLAPECPVCLQPSVNAVRLPCSHVFCYLCVKGVMGHGRRACSLCRAEVPLSFLITPTLVDGDEVSSSSTEQAAIEGRYLWYYEGRRGWWQYDKRAAAELEEKYQAGSKRFDLMIAGFAYVVDLDGGFQYRRQYPTRRRRVKRDLIDIPDRRGVAGIVCRPPPRGATADPPSRSGGDGGEKEGDLGVATVAGGTVTRRSGYSTRATDDAALDRRSRITEGRGATNVSQNDSNVDRSSLRDITASALVTAAAPSAAAATSTTGAAAVSAAATSAVVIDDDVLAENFRTLTVSRREEREDTNEGTEQQNPPRSTTTHGRTSSRFGNRNSSNGDTPF